MGDAVRDGEVPSDPEQTIDARSRVGAGDDAPFQPSPPAPDYSELVKVERHHYMISREIAKGGMGRVLAARDLRLGRDVAIKELLPRNRDAARRFEREARITARLQHPGIIHVYEAGTWPGGEPFYAMPRVAGRSLDKVVAERTTLADRLGLVPTVMAVADALAYAHAEHVIHRDLKPANVLVGEFGQTVVIDWGLAKDLGDPSDPKESTAMRVREEAAETTASGSVVGTPAYMPPEQARGELVDQRADVYAIGALLYKVLCGEAPYVAASSSQTLELVKRAPPVPIRDREPGAPRELVAIVDKAMARDPAARYATAGELAQDLKRFETGQLVAAHRYTTRQLISRWLYRHRIAVIAAIVLATLGAYSVSRIIAEQRDAVAQRQTAVAGRIALLEEKGRTELVDSGHAGTALAYLVAAAEQDHQWRGARGFLIADAMRPFQAEVATLPTGASNVVVAVSPDGHRVATAGDSGVELWLDPGRAAAVRLIAPGRISALAFDPTGGKLVAAGDDGVARVWTADGKLVAELARGERSPIADAAFDATGENLVTAHADGTAHVWRGLAGPGVTVTCHDAAVVSARFSPSGDRIATASLDNTACVANAVTGAVIIQLRGHTRPVSSARWSHDGKLIVTASDDGTARVWNAAGGKLVVQPLAHDRGAVAAAELASDDRRIVTAGDDRVARVWRLPAAIPDPLPDGFTPLTARLATRLAGHTDRISLAAFSADDSRIATAGFDQVAKVWDAATGQNIATFEHADIVSSVAFAPDGNRLVTGSRDGRGRVWNIPQPLGIHASDSAVHAIAVSRDGVVAAGTDDSRVTLWRGAKPTVLTGHASRVYAVAFSPDGTRLVTGGEDPRVLVWDAAGKQVGAFDTPGHRDDDQPPPVRAIAVAADNATVAIAAGGVVRLWSLHGGGPRALEAKSGASEQLAFSADGSLLAGGGADGALVVWDAATGKQLTDRVEHGPVTALAFAPDGRALVVAGQGELRIYGNRAGVLDAAPRRQIEGPTGEVRAVAFTHDGTLVVTASDDGVARVWDAEKGKLLGTRGDHRKPLSSLAVTPSDTLWIGSEDGTVVAWDVGANHVDPAEVARLMKLVPWKLDGDVARRTP